MKKVIDLQPIIEQLKDTAEASQGVERSILIDVICMLESAPAAEIASKFVLIDNAHLNTDQIRRFEWKDGDLCIWYAGHHFFEHMEDPGRKLYKDLCYALKVLPTEDPEE